MLRPGRGQPGRMLAAGLGVLVMTLGTAQAEPIELIRLNTGKGISIGELDPNWDVVSAPAAITLGAAKAIGRFVGGGAGWPDLPRLGAQWLGPQEANDARFDQLPRGNYRFRTRFTVNQTGGEDFSISGRYYVGDSMFLGHIRINGDEVVSCCPGAVFDPFEDGFSRELFIDNSHFINGVNELEILISHGGTIGTSRVGFGFRGSVFSESIGGVPEPATASLVVFGALLHARRRGPRCIEAK